MQGVDQRTWGLYGQDIQPAEVGILWTRLFQFVSTANKHVGFAMVFGLKHLWHECIFKICDGMKIANPCRDEPCRDEPCRKGTCWALGCFQKGDALFHPFPKRKVRKETLSSSWMSIRTCGCEDIQCCNMIPYVYLVISHQEMSR